ncbi:hypothetical protein GCM10018952_30080 [Streptosporangium vulgare]
MRVSSAERAGDRTPGAGLMPRTPASSDRSVKDWCSVPDSTSQRFQPVSSFQSRSQEVSRPPGTCCGVPMNMNGLVNPVLGIRA